MIQIESEGQDIIKTNFWNTEWNKKGAVACSLNAGALRLLIPDRNQGFIREMQTAKAVIVSKGKCRGRTAYEFLFDDGTSTPFSLLIGDNQMVLQIADHEHGKPIRVTAWTRGVKKQFDMEGRFRVVRSLPCLRAWGDE